MNSATISRIFSILSNYYFSTIVTIYAFSIPFQNNIKSIFLLLILVVWLFDVIKRPSQYLKILNSTTFRTILLLFILYIISYWQSEDKPDALRFLILQSTIFLLPIAFYRQLSDRQIKIANYSFVISLIILSLYALLKTYIVYVGITSYTTTNSIDWNYFSFKLPHAVNFHAPYFSLYIAAGLFLVLGELLKISKPIIRIKLIILVIIAIYFICFIVLLSSRTALFSTLIIGSTLLIIKFIKFKKYYATGLFILGIIVFALTAINYAPYLSGKLKENAGYTERKILWNSSLAIIKNNTFMGVGIGDREEALRSQFELIDYEKGLEIRQNSHNQYLDTSISIGIIGLGSLLLLLITLLNLAIRRRKLAFLSIILLFSFCCLTETLLHRQAGVIFFSYFCAIFVFAPQTEDN